MPGVLSWTTLIGVALLSWLTPVGMAIFIIFFDVYWFLKTFYLSIHLRISYRKMRNNMEINWLEKLKTDPATTAWPDIYHLIVFPFFDEPYEVIKESFEALARINYPLGRFIVAIGTEEKAGEAAKQTLDRITAEYANTFFKLVATVHPSNLPGEAPGKGSNEAWIAQQVKQEVIDPLRIPYERIVVSSFDIDTQIFPD